MINEELRTGLIISILLKEWGLMKTFFGFMIIVSPFKKNS